MLAIEDELLGEQVCRCGERDRAGSRKAGKHSVTAEVLAGTAAGVSTSRPAPAMCAEGAAAAVLGVAASKLGRAAGAKFFLLSQWPSCVFRVQAVKCPIAWLGICV